MKIRWVVHFLRLRRVDGARPRYISLPNGYDESDSAPRTNSDPSNAHVFDTKEEALQCRAQAIVYWSPEYCEVKPRRVP